ncbi:hypothetical protein HGRIS_006246 [Hohenbuehelia grisea]|uniref:GST N-terminal domain-containing protein n=1 Tax=Hohenbuehelia grisea TaxID=104357 RepID=A0ABR3K248_9AGAR
MSSSVITLYDLATTLKPDQAWSGNTLRARFALNYKGLPFKTVYVEFPDIEKVCKKIGAAPTSLKPNGDPLYHCAPKNG